MIERYSQKRSQSLEDEDTSTYFKANLYQLSTAQYYVFFGLCISWRLNVRFHGGRRSHQNSSHIPFSFNNSTSSSLRNSHKGASVFFFFPFLEATQVDPLTSVGADIGAYYRPEKNSRRVAQASLVLVSVNKQHQESLRVGYFTVRFILFPHISLSLRVQSTGFTLIFVALWLSSTIPPLSRGSLRTLLSLVLPLYPLIIHGMQVLGAATSPNLFNRRLHTLMRLKPSHFHLSSLTDEKRLAHQPTLRLRLQYHGLQYSTRTRCLHLRHYLTAKSQNFPMITP